jgi:hypothetical protein
MRRPRPSAMSLTLWSESKEARLASRTPRLPRLATARRRAAMHEGRGWLVAQSHNDPAISSVKPSHEVSRPDPLFTSRQHRMRRCGSTTHSFNAQLFFVEISCHLNPV